MKTKPQFEKYPFTVEPGSDDDGSGYFVSFPDLPGCLADGETYEEAICNARDAFDAWMAANAEDGNSVPLPGHGHQPVKFVQRLPGYVHKKLTRTAELEGVSMNTMATLLISEGLARREARLESSAHRAAASWQSSTTFVRALFGTTDLPQDARNVSEASANAAGLTFCYSPPPAIAYRGSHGTKVIVRESAVADEHGPVKRSRQ